MAGKVPFGAIFFGLLGAGAVVRTFYRPHRAVVRDGYALRCAGGASCDKAVTIESMRGVAPVYAASPGVAVVAPGMIKIVSSREPVVLTYRFEGSHSVHVAHGQKVGMGQPIAQAGRVGFAVDQALRTGTAGDVKFKPLVPSAWLAARGLRLSSKHRRGEQQWCEGGRRLAVPEQALKCGMDLPEPASFMLLPVSVTTA